MQPSPTHERAVSSYEQRLAQLKQQATALEHRSKNLSLLRLITLLAALGLGGYALAAATPWWVGALSGLIFAFFVVAVVAHALLVTRMSDIEQRMALYDLAKKRALGDFTTFAQRGEHFATADHDYAADLDIFGQASLFQLVNVAQTGQGEATLAAWLRTPASVDELVRRQASVRELSAMTEFREELSVAGMQAGARESKEEPLIAWAKEPATLDSSTVRGLLLTAKVVVPVTLAAFAASQTLGREVLGPLYYLWIAPLLLQAVVLTLLRPTIEPNLAKAASREAPFGRYRPILSCIEQQKFSSPLLKHLRAQLLCGSDERPTSSASREMTSLQKIIGYTDLRHNGIVHLIVNLAVLWDVWCALALERWRLRSGHLVQGWLDTLGQVEALASFANFAYDNPDYAFPDVVVGEAKFEVIDIGHPLIRRDRRVVNDVTLAQPGTALLVTGSNMSGKSTLLRSMGINAALALAGAPVCASALTMSPLTIRTSMRIKDSLEQGVSHFYAELQRLKRVVDSANRGDQVLFLLDEILHGTNSRERNIGAKSVICHLLDKGTIGAVSSHDLALCHLEEDTSGRVRNMHFEELVAEDKMTFDYKLKPGVVKSANALRLMKIAGIEVSLLE